MSLAKLLQDSVLVHGGQVDAGYEPGTSLANWTHSRTRQFRDCLLTDPSSSLAHWWPGCPLRGRFVGSDCWVTARTYPMGNEQVQRLITSAHPEVPADEANPGLRDRDPRR